MQRLCSPLFVQRQTIKESSSPSLALRSRIYESTSRWIFIAYLHTRLAIDDLGIEILINRRKNAVTCKWTRIILPRCKFTSIASVFLNAREDGALRVIIAILLITDIDLSIIPGFIFEALRSKAKYYTRSPAFLFCYHVILIIFLHRIIHNILKMLLTLYYTYNIDSVCFLFTRLLKN